MPVLQHLHLHVRNRAASIAFYTRWFGFRVVKTKPDQTHLRDQADFLLVLMDDPAPAPLPVWMHYGFVFETPALVLAAHSEMQTHKVIILKTPYQDDAITVFRCADPDGYVLELYCLAPEV